MKPGKYVGATFTPNQIKARRMSQKALTMRVNLADALRSTPDTMSRATWHQRLDRYLDQIERLQTDARELFPDVEESFVIASDTIRLS